MPCTGFISDAKVCVWKEKKDKEIMAEEKNVPLIHFNAYS
jgi:hypothetical protein